MVVAPVNGAQPYGKQCCILPDDIDEAFAGDVAFGNFDLVENLSEVGEIDDEAGGHLKLSLRLACCRNVKFGSTQGAQIKSAFTTGTEVRTYSDQSPKASRFPSAKR